MAYVYVVAEMRDGRMGLPLSVLPTIEAALDGLDWIEDTDDFGRRCWYEHPFADGYWVVEYQLGHDARRGDD